jgi:hypothetical protein
MKLALLSTQLILFLPPLHVLSLAWHMYVYPIVPILSIFFLTSAKDFQGRPSGPSQLRNENES